MRRGAPVPSFAPVSQGLTSVKGAKPALLLSIAMTFLSFNGIAFSYGQLNAPAAPDQDITAPPTSEQAATEQLYAAISAAPVARGLAVANLLASALLLVGSLMITARNRSAHWWVSQALLANLAYSLAATVGAVYIVSGLRPEIEALMTLTAARQQAAQGAPTAAEVAQMAEMGPWVFGAMTLLACLALVCLYLVLIRVSRRADVREFLLAGRPSRPA